MQQKAALLSVYDRTGIVEFARELAARGYVLLTTSGTGKALTEAGIKHLPVESYTGQKEILDGRVKTLHPRIHAGLLARRDSADHMRQLETDGIYQIDVAAINLYPFLQALHTDAVQDPAKMTEVVDVGGPTMIRAAAKNYKAVYAVIDPADYSRVLSALAEDKTKSHIEFRRTLAAKVFSTTAAYDLAIARYFSAVTYDEQGKPRVEADADFTLSPVSGAVLVREQELRYGENPHQAAAFYRPHNSGQKHWEQLSGKELSYNNLLDLDAGLRLMRELPSAQPAVVILKHLNPCGMAVAENAVTALRLSKSGDTRSHFGGVIALNCRVDADCAREITSDFKEIVIAPDFSPEALELIQAKKNVRVIRADISQTNLFEYRSAAGGILLQQADPGVSPLAEARLVSEHPATPAALRDLELAWLLCAHVKSNAITLVKDGVLIGAGAGQMSRVDSVEIALQKARAHGHDPAGAVAGSDAFFPFIDAIVTFAAQGVKTIIAPAGAKNDDEVAACARELGVSLYFAADRHFRH